MDELKKYFKQHEKEMQVELPDEKRIWQGIEAHQHKKKGSARPVVRMIRFAAAACIILFVGLGIRSFMNGKETKPAQPTADLKKPVPLTKDTSSKIVQPIVAQVEMRPKQLSKVRQAKQQQPMDDGYAQLISYQLRQLRTTPVYAESPEYFSEFKLQMQQMNKDEALLKKDIKAYGLNNQLLEQLINLYQQKLNLLKSLQGEINKMNNRVLENQSTGERHAYYLNI